MVYTSASVRDRRADGILPPIAETVLDVSGATGTFLPEFRHRTEMTFIELDGRYPAELL
jgi:hypothetical protein